MRNYAIPLAFATSYLLSPARADFQAEKCPPGLEMLVEPLEGQRVLFVYRSPPECSPCEVYLPLSSYPHFKEMSGADFARAAAMIYGLTCLTKDQQHQTTPEKLIPHLGLSFDSSTQRIKISLETDKFLNGGKVSSKNGKTTRPRR
ncbi:hypothetical protein COV20_00685 [Candidatus Woesearchaeota archaeon CG10_big_fil_rev_8_21_14_0_10_45_16]|nr:MAG: hypothetical protein COV20_00685 [Candidatus Woesearchaeota archaeon CG10_big_fil_rev_8_21_14_0_10_45_16]